MRVEPKHILEIQYPAFHLDQSLRHQVVDTINHGSENQWSLTSAFESIKNAIMSFFRWIGSFFCYTKKNEKKGQGGDWFLGVDNETISCKNADTYLFINELKVKKDGPLKEHLSQTLIDNLKKHNLKEVGIKNLDGAAILWELGWQTNDKIEYDPKSTKRSSVIPAVKDIIKKVKAKESTLDEKCRNALEKIEHPEKSESSQLGDFTLVDSQYTVPEISLNDLFTVAQVVEDRSCCFGEQEKVIIFTPPKNPPK